MSFSLADLLNAPSEFVFEKKTYHIRQATLIECATYQRWLESEARASAARAVELPDADRRNLLADIQTAISAQEYAWGGEVCVRSLRTPHGFGRLLSIVCADQGVTPKMGLRMAEARLKELAGLVLGALEDDPTGGALRQLLKSVGLPLNFFADSSSGSATSPAENPPMSPPSAA